MGWAAGGGGGGGGGGKEKPTILDAAESGSKSKQHFPDVLECPVSFSNTTVLSCVHASHCPKASAKVRTSSSKVSRGDPLSTQVKATHDFLSA